MLATRVRHRRPKPVPARAGWAIAMLEAMALALPCVDTNVGGIPELLPRSAMCNPGDARAIAGLMRSVMTDQDYADSLAERCQRTARGYSLDVLTSRRGRLLRHLREASARHPRPQR